MNDLHHRTTPNGHWLTMFLEESALAGLAALPKVARALAGIKARPATGGACGRAAEVNTQPTASAASAGLLFGQTAAAIAKP